MQERTGFQATDRLAWGRLMNGIRKSFGLVMYRRGDRGWEVLIAHPGGPYYVHKQEGHWTIPKGGQDAGESELEAAVREFYEETGLAIPEQSDFLDLGVIVQKGGKHVQAWGVGCPWEEVPPMESRMICIEWPPRSGQQLEVPEMDRSEFIPMERACQLIKSSQVPLLQRLERMLES